jgi:DNA-directed RNA polymerase subunit RPC12/RpoP
MKIDKYPIPITCPYCSSDVIYTSNAAIYSKEYGNGRVYKCTGCDAYVGVHTGTDIPLGRLANKELRQLKKQCHALFDPTWKGKKVRRHQAYSMMGTRLGISTNECHFGWFDKDLLLKAIEILKEPDCFKGEIE